MGFEIAKGALREAPECTDFVTKKREGRLSTAFSSRIRIDDSIMNGKY